MLVHYKTRVAFNDENNEDKCLFKKLVESVNTNYNNRFKDIHKHWGGGIMGNKS